MSTPLKLDTKDEWSPDPTFCIDTPRLFLGHCSPDSTEEIDVFVALSAITGERTIPHDEMQGILRKRNSQALQFGWPGWFRATLKETGKLIGRCALVRARAPRRTVVAGAGHWLRLSPGGARERIRDRGSEGTHRLGAGNAQCQRGLRVLFGGEWKESERAEEAWIGEMGSRGYYNVQLQG